ncbi:uncharacterized protein [Panulirus ornatus]|uniref:uncharacterized protein n=1 Tax=Panulirus ornatus TaxID=150431 RepID=UPI003A861480
MAAVSNLRRSGRRTVRPVEYWNFEKPDSKSEKIIYNISDLSKYSIYSPFSTKYLHDTSKKSAKGSKLRDKKLTSNANETDFVERGNCILNGQEELGVSLRDARPHNSKGNTHEESQKKSFNREKENSVACTVFKVPEGRAKRMDKVEANSQDAGVGGQSKNDRPNKEHITSSSNTVMSDSVVCRRSGRVRTKPLEFWNFEKVEIKTLDNGDVSVIHHKQVLPPPKRKKSKEKEKAAAAPHPSITPRRKSCEQTIQKLSSQSSPCKRKLFVPFCDNLYKDTPFEDEHPSKRKRTLDGVQDSTVTPAVQVTKFTDLTFCERTAKDYKCYLARSFQDTERDIYAGFIFLERGKVIWNTTKETNLYVIEGYGTLLMVDGTAKGVAVHLKDAFQTTITHGKKISIQKGGRCKMLKLFIVLGSSSGTSSSIPQDSMMSDSVEKQVTAS